MRDVRDVGAFERRAVQMERDLWVGEREREIAWLQSEGRMFGVDVDDVEEGDGDGGPSENDGEEDMLEDVLSEEKEWEAYIERMEQASREGRDAMEAKSTAYSDDDYDSIFRDLLSQSPKDAANTMDMT